MEHRVHENAFIACLKMHKKTQKAASEHALMLFLSTGAGGLGGVGGGGVNVDTAAVELMLSLLFFMSHFSNGLCIFPLHIHSVSSCCSCLAEFCVP